MIHQSTLTINSRIFFISYACYGRLHACTAELVRLTLTASLTSLILAGLIDADSDLLRPEGYFILMPWQRTTKEASVSSN